MEQMEHKWNRVEQIFCAKVPPLKNRLKSGTNGTFYYLLFYLIENK